MKACKSRVGRAALWIASELCFHQYPWGFECVVMYARYECHSLIGAGAEAELLIELWTSRVVLLQCSPDPLDGVQGLGGWIMILLEKAALYFCC